MPKNVVLKSNPFTTCLLGFGMTAALAACGGGTTPQSQQATIDNPTIAAADARAAELETRAQQLAQREAELAAKEQEQESARQQAAEAAQRQREAAAKAAAEKKAALAKAASVKNAAVASANTVPAKAAPLPAAEPIEVPPGTQLSVALTSELSTKTGKPGDEFEARLVADLVINDHCVVPAGSRITGTIKEVVSGSNAIGAVPMLALKFEHLQLADGRQIPISGEFMQQGKSEKGRDAAKILGGAAAGAIIGHQVKNNDTGTVVGGLLGGAAGAVAAKKTGTEVQLAAGATLTITLDQGFKIARS